MLSNENATVQAPRPLVLPKPYTNQSKEVSDLWLALGDSPLYRRLFFMSAIARTLHLALYHAGDENAEDTFGVVAEFLAAEIDETTNDIAELFHKNGVVAPKNAI